MTSKEKAFYRVLLRTSINGDCLEFNGNTGSCGYGMIKMNSEPTAKMVHRFMYEMLVGKIPKGMYACHKCDNRICWNPKHIFIGTAKDNMVDMHIKGRSFLTTGMKNGNCKVTTEQVEAIRKDTRSLRVIANEYGLVKSTVSEIKNYKSRIIE